MRASELERDAAERRLEAGLRYQLVHVWGVDRAVVARTRHLEALIALRRRVVKTMITGYGPRCV